MLTAAMVLILIAVWLMAAYVAYWAFLTDAPVSGVIMSMLLGAYTLICVELIKRIFA